MKESYNTCIQSQRQVNDYKPSAFWDQDKIFHRLFVSFRGQLYLSNMMQMPAYKQFPLVLDKHTCSNVHQKYYIFKSTFKTAKALTYDVLGMWGPRQRSTNCPHLYTVIVLSSGSSLIISICINPSQNPNKPPPFGESSMDQGIEKLL